MLWKHESDLLISSWCSDPKTGKSHTVMDLIKKFYYAPLRMLASLVKTNAANRAKMSEFLTKKRYSNLLTAILIVTMSLWFCVWLFADDADRSRLTELLKGFVN